MGNWFQKILTYICRFVMTKNVEENIGEYVKLPVSLYFIFRAYGDSMTNTGIENGDFALISYSDFRFEMKGLLYLEEKGNRDLLIWCMSVMKRSLWLFIRMLAMSTGSCYNGY